jgi:Mg2+/Co2+ transporter CorB
MINLKDLERKLDDALSKESPETLTSFIIEKRQNMKNIDIDGVKNKIQSLVLYKLYDRIENQVNHETVDKIKDKVGHQIYDQTHGQVYSETKNQLWNQVIRKIKL